MFYFAQNDVCYMILCWSFEVMRYWYRVRLELNAERVV